MHSKNIVHRDLKPENILMENKEKMEVKLTDFGFSTVYDEKIKLDLQCGTPFMMAPEIINKN